MRTSSEHCFDPPAVASPITAADRLDRSRLWWETCSLLGGTFTMMLLTIGLAACGSSHPASRASGSTGKFNAQVEQGLQRVVSVVRDNYHVPGMAVAVTVPGEGSWVKASGLADTSTKQALDVNDKFRIGSITKTFTATVVLQLVQEGKLSLSAPINRWVPKVQNAKSITVRMLLNMTSGIYDEGGPGSGLAKRATINPSKVWAPQEIVMLAIVHGPAGPPGRFEYSDTNYVILGIIARAVSGKPIQSLIVSQILKPLHLANTGYPTTPTMPGLATTGYYISSGRLIPAPRYDPSVFGAAGAMISTLGDLQTWAKALATGALLNPRTQQQGSRFSAAGTFPPLPGAGISAGLPVKYGLGIFSLGGLLGHNGSYPGWTSDMFYLPARKATIVVLLNGLDPKLQGTTISDAATVSLAQIVLPHAVSTAPAAVAP